MYPSVTRGPVNIEKASYFFFSRCNRKPLPLT